MDLQDCKALFQETLDQNRWVSEQKNSYAAFAVTVVKEIPLDWRWVCTSSNGTVLVYYVTT